MFQLKKRGGNTKVYGIQNYVYNLKQRMRLALWNIVLLNKNVFIKYNQCHLVNKAIKKKSF